MEGSVVLRVDVLERPRGSAVWWYLAGWLHAAGSLDSAGWLDLAGMPDESGNSSRLN